MRKVIKQKNAVHAYQNWRDSRYDKGCDSTDLDNVNDELKKAEPDLMPFPEPNASDELAAAIEVIQEGGLTHLSAVQQRIFQLHVVEGWPEGEVAKELRVSREAIKYEVERIGTVLRKLCLRKL